MQSKQVHWLRAIQAHQKKINCIMMIMTWSQPPNREMPTGSYNSSQVLSSFTWPVKTGNTSLRCDVESSNTTTLLLFHHCACLHGLSPLILEDCAVSIESTYISCIKGTKRRTYLCSTTCKHMWWWNSYYIYAHVVVLVLQWWVQEFVGSFLC